MKTLSNSKAVAEKGSHTQNTMFVILVTSSEQHVGGKTARKQGRICSNSQAALVGFLSSSITVPQAEDGDEEAVTCHIPWRIQLLTEQC